MENEPNLVNAIKDIAPNLAETDDEQMIETAKEYYDEYYQSNPSYFNLQIVRLEREILEKIESDKFYNIYDNDNFEQDVASSVNKPTLYVDTDNYRYFEESTSKAMLFFRTASTFGDYIFLLHVIYLVIRQIRSMMPEATETPPNWALLYVPVLLYCGFKLINYSTKIKLTI